MSQSVFEGGFDKSDKKWVQRHVARLPEIYQVAIILRFWHNCSILEAARVLQLSWSQTDQVINEALEILKESIIHEVRFQEASLRSHFKK